MQLFINELGHLVVYFVTVFFIYKLDKKYFSIKNTATGLNTAFFIDVDHLFDYFVYFGLKRFNFIEFIQAQQFTKSNRVFVPFHAWEWAFLILIGWLLVTDKEKYSWILFISVGLFVHLTFDVISNGFPWYSYMFTNRLIHGFSSIVLQ